MAFTNPKTQLYKDQYDILIEDTGSNPYLKKSASASRNKALNTKSKQVIKSINELKDNSDKINKTLIAGLAAQNTFIGDFANDKTLYDNFQATGYKSIGEAVVGMNNHVSNLVSEEYKDVVFVFPKYSAETVNPEIFVPFKGKIVKIFAKISNTDNVNRASDSSIVDITVKHSSKDGIVFQDVSSLSIGTNATYAEYNLTDPLLIDKEVLKVSIDKASIGLMNLNVIVRISKEV